MGPRYFLFPQYIYVIVVVIVLLVCLYSRTETFENNKPTWHNDAESEFFNLFKRPMDPIHVAYYKKSTNNLSSAKSLQFIRNDLLKYKTEVDEGTQKAEKSKIVITGLLQNGARQIPELRDRCEEIVSYFKDYRIIILENNSIDTSRRDLLDWTASDERVKILCQDPFVTNSEECTIDRSSGVSDKSPLPPRIQKMAMLRNIYLEHIYHYYKDFDYLCVIDMDLEGDLHMDGLLHSVGLINPKIDGVTCNGMLRLDDEGFYYYDSFAYMEEDDMLPMTDMTQKSEHDRYVHINVTKLYTSQMVPDRVYSAFGGCALYNLKAMANNRYNYSQNAYMCEHTYFHNGKSIYVNPRMVFFITHNS